MPFVGPDNRKGAKLVGDFLAKQIKSGDKAAIIEEVSTTINAQQRTLGFQDAMAAAERGINVPDALSVIGFDDIDLAQLVHPTLTSVSQNMRTLGQVAAQCLLERIINPSHPVQRKIIMPQLHIRGQPCAPD